MALRNAFGALALDTTVTAIKTWLEARTGAKTTANSISVNIASDQTISVSGPLTDTQLRATPLPVSGTVAISNSSVEISNDAGNAVPVSAAALPLPNGAATSAEQVTGNTRLSNIDGKLPALDTGYVPVLVKNGQLEVTNDTGNPIPVNAASLPLPTGAATETTLSDIASKTPALQSGRVPVDIGSASVTITGPVTVANEVEVTNNTGNPIPTSVMSMPEGLGSLRDVITLLEIMLSRQPWPDNAANLRTNLSSYPTQVNVSGGGVSQLSVHTGHVGGFQANLDQMAKVSTAAATALRANITVS